MGADCSALSVSARNVSSDERRARKGTELFCRGQVEWVRLGDLDIDSGSESKRDYQVIKRIYHPGYKPPALYNDVGLVLIELPVTFTLFIKPACLFGRDTIGQYIDLISTGWGLTQFGGDNSNTLQKVYLDLFTPDECSYMYNATTRKLPDGIRHESQFCAGGRGLERDTCQVGLLKIHNSAEAMREMTYNNNLVTQCTYKTTRIDSFINGILMKFRWGLCEGSSKNYNFSFVF